MGRYLKGNRFGMIKGTKRYLKGNEKWPNSTLKRKGIEKGKDGVGHPKAFEVPTKKNTGMDENIPVLTKDRAKTILYPYYITYMKALLSILKSTASLLSNNFLRLVFDFLF